MKLCEDYEHLISARLDGTLTPEETASLDAHLSQCPRCRAFAREMEALHDTMTDLAEEVPPTLNAALAAQDWSQIPQQAPLPPSKQTGQEAPPLNTRRHRRLLPMISCSAAAVVLLLVALGQLLLPSGGDGSSDPSIMEFFPWNGSQSEQSDSPSYSEDEADSQESRKSSAASGETTQPDQSEPGTADASQPTEGTQPADGPADSEASTSPDPAELPPETGGSGSTAGSPPPSDEPNEGDSTPLLTVQEAQALVSDHLASQGRQLTLVSTGLVGDSYVFAGKDASGRTVCTFSVSRSTGQILEKAVPDSDGQAQILPPRNGLDGPEPMD